MLSVGHQPGHPDGAAAGGEQKERRRFAASPCTFVPARSLTVTRSVHLRRHQEEGARRQLQECGSRVTAADEPEFVDVHDFPDDAVGEAAPYGIYEPAA